MKYLIRANKLVFSGNVKMLMKYISDFYKSESKVWTDKNGKFTDFRKFKAFIKSISCDRKRKLRLEFIVLYS